MYKNSEGYSDPTAGEAMKNIKAQERAKERYEALDMVIKIMRMESSDCGIKRAAVHGGVLESGKRQRRNRMSMKVIGRGFSICDGIGELPTKYLGNAKIPQRATKLSAGYDCYTPMDIRLEPGEALKVHTGIKAWMQPGEVLLAFPRSGLGFKYFCRIANTIGVIDADYYDNPKNEGEIVIQIRNEGDKVMELSAGQAFCQFIFMPFLLANGDSFECGDERAGGFGSTDVMQSAT